MSSANPHDNQDVPSLSHYPSSLPYSATNPFLPPASNSDPQASVSNSCIGRLQTVPSFQQNVSNHPAYQSPQQPTIPSNVLPLRSNPFHPETIAVSPSFPSQPVIPSPSLLIDPIPNNVSDALTIQREDRSYPRVTLRRVRDNTNWTKRQLLDIRKRNYEDWRNHIIDRLDMSSGLSEYLFATPRLNPPLSVNEPVAFSNDRSTDRSVLSYIRSCICEAEHEYVDKCSFSWEAWSTLELRHRSAVTQMQLLRDAFEVRYTKIDEYAETSMKIRRLTNYIWDRGEMTPDIFEILLHLSAARDLADIRNFISYRMSTATTESPFLPVHVAVALETYFR
ncbi:hypothetical protein FISHEDRAFT_69935 [Fistulina hepatica ATCC 64428]|uniref:Uncharacterized protein n=1 Tax=Fistulina hepatica ATCC 64428 TaxID=1128425 RepID=A0A0D7AKH6_9AGAR|nr:hypothetical protein FISHEDRAFT_69935 [Fistulina hepatica ATCC 64428]